MSDRFAGYAGALDDPASQCTNIEPNDNIALMDVSRALYIGGSGSVRLIDAMGNTVDFTGLVGGSILPVRARAVLASGTTATGLVVLA